MLREDIKDKPLNDILKEINEKYGLTKGNSLVAREMTRIYNKVFPVDLVLDVKREAAIRVLCGQKDRVNPLKNVYIGS